MKVLIVLAHHEPASLNGTLARAAARALRAAGHEVQVSDLYALGFDPVSDRRNFRTVADPGYLSQHAEEEHASRQDAYVRPLQAEMDKLAWCDCLILQFPLWWFSMPAILKGWIDRVFAVGRAYGGGRWFQTGVFAGKRAMLSLTVGGSADDFAEGGLHGPMRQVLYPIEHGILGFVGFTVAPAFVVYQPKRLSGEQRIQAIHAFEERVLALAGG